MINLQAAVACRYVFIISGNSDFYQKFGYSITQFKALSNKEKLKHLLNKLGQVQGLKPKVMPRGNFDQIVSAYPAIDYQPRVGPEGVELHFELQPLSKGIRIRADRSTGKAAGAVLVSSITGRCLWVKRSDRGDAPNLWACLGGGVDKGETILEGLRRELYEEGGITMPIPFIPVYKSVQDDGAFAYYNFVGLVGREFEPELNDEHTDFVWSATPPTPLHPKLEEALRQPRYQTTLNKYRKQMLKAKSNWIDKAEQKQKQKPASQQWTPPEGFFKGSASSIANGLKQHSKDYAEASRRLIFYINRSGDNLTSGDKSKLERAKDELKRVYGRNVNAAFNIDEKLERLRERRTGISHKAASTPTLTFDEAKQKYLDALVIVDLLSAKLQKYPKGAMGLTPDSVKKSAQFKRDKGMFDKANADMKTIAAWFQKTYKKEFAQYRAKGGSIYRESKTHKLKAATTPTAVFNVKNPDILEVASASDGKTWHERDDRDKFVFLNKCANMSGTGVTLKLGNNSFRDKVDFNTAYKKPNAKFKFEIGKRRGYVAVIVKVQA